VKKKLFIILLICTALLCTGCAEHIKLTEEESNAIAQYSAYLMMKYDRNRVADFKLIDYKDLQLEKEEEIVIPSPTPVPEPESGNGDDELKGNEPGGSESDDFEAGNTENENKTDDNTPNTDNDNLYSGSYAESLNQVYGAEGFEVSVESYELDDIYYGSVPISAPEGKNILTINFLIKNVTDNTLRYDSLNYPVKYQLIIGEKESIEPQISLLPNDIQFLNNDIEAGVTINGVLLFIVDDERTDYLLRVLGEESENKDTIAYEINLK